MHPAARGTLKLGFAGTPEFAARILEALLAAGWAPALVYTQPERPAGRGRKLQPSPVKLLAQAHDLPIRQPASLRDPTEQAVLQDAGLDVLVVAAYGLLLPPAVLEAPRLGCVNVHPSLLPRWRGAAPIERAILAGDRETGVCIMRMERGLDTGPVYRCRSCPLPPDIDAPTLERQLAHLGGEVLLECLETLPELTPTPQSHQGVAYAAKLSRADAVVRWDGPAAAIERQVRALADRLPPFTEAAGTRMAILEAAAEPSTPTAAPGTIVDAGRTGIRVACGDGELNITRLRLSVGKGRPQSAAEAINGYPGLLAVGTRLQSGESGG